VLEECLNGDPLPADCTPQRFVCSLHGDCLTEGVGPDMTGKPGSPFPVQPN
jgi:hypothetical protein